MAIYTENLEGESYDDGVVRERIPFFYLHGRLEDLAGYDCCDADIEETWQLLSDGIHITNVILPNGDVIKSIVLKKFKLGSMSGFIIAIDDVVNQIEFIKMKDIPKNYSEDVKLELISLNEDAYNIIK